MNIEKEILEKKINILMTSTRIALENALDAIDEYLYIGDISNCGEMKDNLILVCARLDIMAYEAKRILDENN